MQTQHHHLKTNVFEFSLDDKPPRPEQEGQEVSPASFRSLSQQVGDIFDNPMHQPITGDPYHSQPPA